jgi:ribosome-binding ATPase YchF (GTP1/OBG family)
LFHLSLLRLPKIKAWIDANNPGDPLIPFSVALEERLASLSPEEEKEEEIKAGATSALPKITQAGYSSLDVGSLFNSQLPWLIDQLTAYSLFHLRAR